jgi:hypothetical protein
VRSEPAEQIPLAIGQGYGVPGEHVEGAALPGAIDAVDHDLPTDVVAIVEIGSEASKYPGIRCELRKGRAKAGTVARNDLGDEPRIMVHFESRFLPSRRNIHPF